LTNAEFESRRLIVTDEISIGKGNRNLPVVQDLLGGALVFIGNSNGNGNGDGVDEGIDAAIPEKRRYGKDNKRSGRHGKVRSFTALQFSP